MAYLVALLVLCIPLGGVYGLVQLTQRAIGRTPSRNVSFGLRLVAAAFFITLGTLFVPVEITADNARAADFGFPIHFVTADTALSPSAGVTVRTGYDPWEYPADFHWNRFFGSWGIVSALLLLPLILLAAVRRRARARPLRPSARRS